MTPPGPGLLVSVRSATEAQAAVTGGASVIDIKEPNHGPLGRASFTVWREVRAVVPAHLPVSVALGELSDFDPTEPWPPDAFTGIAFRKLGLAGMANLDWLATWASVRRAMAGPPWVAVIYADWDHAAAPDPEDIIAAAIEIPECAGVLVDTWIKTRPSPLEPSPEWSDRLARVRQSGRFVALAGGLQSADFARLSKLEPDLFAVRGAGCVGSNRQSSIDPARVAELVRALSVRRASPDPRTCSWWFQLFI